MRRGNVQRGREASEKQRKSNERERKVTVRVTRFSIKDERDTGAHDAELTVCW